MKIKEITQYEFETIIPKKQTNGAYYVNGCFFAEITDNLVAFSVREKPFSPPVGYYEVVYD